MLRVRSALEQLLRSGQEFCSNPDFEAAAEGGGRAPAVSCPCNRCQCSLAYPANNAPSTFETRPSASYTFIIACSPRTLTVYWTALQKRSV